MTRVHNFNAGPAILPLDVVQETAAAVLDFNGTGMGIMEISHRSKEFDAMIKEAQADLLSIMNLSADEYAVLFLGGGASMQFLMVASNFLKTSADYIVTGVWAKKAYEEAAMLGDAKVSASSKETKFNQIPKTWNLNPDADYVHITTNNTIYGTEWKTLPETGNVPLVADMSSNFLSRPYDFGKCNLIYAGAQKNVGPSGVTIVIIKKSWMEKANEKLPTMLNYRTHIDNESLFNTPPCLPIYAFHRTMKWILKMGGLEAIQLHNEKKAAYIYDVIDKYSDFYKGHVVVKEDRSLMNISWNLPSAELEEKFVKEAKALNMVGLKGHRSVGGIRASTYNALPLESAEALANFMVEFYNNNK